jgi:hypothetical protein
MDVLYDTAVFGGYDMFLPHTVEVRVLETVFCLKQTAVRCEVPEHRNVLVKKLLL